MKNKFKILCCLTCIVSLSLVVSCNKDNHLNNGNTGKGKKRERVEIQSYLMTDSSVYVNYLSEAENTIGLASFKGNTLEKPMFKSILNVTKTSNLKSGGGSPGFKIYANNYEIKPINSLKSTNLDAPESFPELYGKNVTLSFKPESNLKNAKDKVDTSITMYVPELVEITMPTIKKTNELLPLCYYKNFILGWNADVKNKNGLVVSVEWLGSYFNVSEDLHDFVRNVDIIKKDDGKTVLNPKLFNNIPENALIYITLLRGNFDLTKINNYSYKLYAESHVVLPCVLVRDKSKYRKSNKH
jgi:hypothetical protein